MKRIVIVGRVPPPPGGVGASIVSILDALRSQPGLQASLLTSPQIWRLIWLRPHIVHYNFSNPEKRLLGSLLAKCVGARVVHTVHGNDFSFNNPANRMAMYLSDGFILVNERIYRDFVESGAVRNLALMTPILRSMSGQQDRKLDNEASKCLDAFVGRRIAAVYAHSKDYRDGIETYGFKFVAGLLPQLNAMCFTVIFLDTNGEYDDSELDPHEIGNIIHMKHGVDFRALCRRIDVYLRPTATDGNSVAVLEALDEGIPVVASDIVPRPSGTTLYEYGNEIAFLDAMLSLPGNEKPAAERVGRADCRFSTVEDYLRFLAQLG